MFIKNETDKRRVVIVDVSHLFYKFKFGGASPLSSTIMVDGQPKIVDTTLPTYTIKTLHRWSRGGTDPLVVCFDGAGCSKSRKAYFTKTNGLNGTEPVGYKSTRDSQNGSFYEGINLTLNLLIQGGVTCIKAEGYEADDLIKAVVDKAKIDYPNLPIDIVTGDQDLLPLIDDQVSVFLASRKVTWAEEKSIEKNHYIQLTPNNLQDYIEGVTEFKNLSIPYNTVLLKKLLRGKKADDIPAYPKFTPTKFNNLVANLAEDGYDLSTLFRYDSPTETICYKVTEEPIPQELLATTPRERMMMKYGEPPALTKMCEVLSQYLEPEIISHIKFIYNGVNLNGAFTGLGDNFNRRPAKISAPIQGYDFVKLQQAVSILRINLPVI